MLSGQTRIKQFGLATAIQKRAYHHSRVFHGDAWSRRSQGATYSMVVFKADLYFSWEGEGQGRVGEKRGFMEAKTRWTHQKKKPHKSNQKVLSELPSYAMQWKTFFFLVEFPQPKRERYFIQASYVDSCAEKRKRYPTSISKGISAEVQGLLAFWQVTAGGRQFIATAIRAWCLTGSSSPFLSLGSPSGPLQYIYARSTFACLHSSCTEDSGLEHFYFHYQSVFSK